MLTADRLIIRGHIVKRILERRVTVDDVLQVINAGEVLREYPDDRPYPSCLRLGFSGGRPLHVVSAVTPEGLEIVITAYEPDRERWNEGFKTRRPS